MFDFERLEVYAHTRTLVGKLFQFCSNEKDRLDNILSSKLNHSAQEMLFKLAEGTGRMATEDKKNYLTESRSAAFACVAILQVMTDLHQIEESQYNDFYTDLEQVSKMLLGMIRSYSK